jgi:LCP family protein required for cell wall assembly
MSRPPTPTDLDATQVIEPITGQPRVDPQHVARPPQRRRRRRRIVMIVLAVVAVLAGSGAAGAAIYVRSIDHGITRIQAFDAVPEQSRPTKAAAAGDAENFLVLGSDTRDPSNTGGSRSDTIILLHMPKDRASAQLVSIPRDTWVHVPRSGDGKQGGTDAKINAAFAWGGAALTVQTVEDYTGVRVDHVVMVDFSGFKEIVDALGGVDIDVEEGFTSTHSLNANSIRVFRKGMQTMDGAAALDYSRERFAFTDGDFARIRHQQQVIKAILSKASSGGLLTNPAQLNSFLRATAKSVAVDDKLNILDTAMALRHLRSENLSFFTNPTTGTGMKGSESVVLGDDAKAKVFYDAVRRDDAAAIAATGTVK